MAEGGKSERSMMGVLWFACPLLGGIAALLFGQDANWDLRNYHFYIPYAFLEGRFDHDVVPSQVANFYNPLLYIPFYHAVAALPPKVVGFAIGALQGLNGPLIYAVARKFLTEGSWGVLLVMVVGVTGGGFLGELGTSFADTILSCLVLWSLWLNLGTVERFKEERGAACRKAVFFAGCLAGCAAGLKQPTAVYAVGLCGAFLVAGPSLQRGVLTAFLFGIGVLAGMAATGGFWFTELWQRYGNPLFPYFNHIFQSPWGAPADYRDARFLPENVVAALRFPFNFAFDPYRTGEAFFRDFRIPILTVCLAGFLPTWILCRLKRGKTPGSATPESALKSRYLLGFGIITFVVWLKLFAIYRYLLVLEMLAPLGIWLILKVFLGSRRCFAYLSSGCMLFLMLSSQPADWGRVPWGDDYFGVRAPELEAPDRTLVLMAGTEPMAYLIPFFPKEVRFLRILSYFTGPSSSPNRFDEKMEEAIEAHGGSIYVIYREYEEQSTDAALEAYGLERKADGCVPLRPHIEQRIEQPLLFCPVAKVGGDRSNI
jgi:hypothetical protein